MGIVLPPNLPLLDPTTNYRISVNIYNGTCATVRIGTGLGFRTGAQINAWYDAGSQCVVGQGILSSNPAWSEFITDVQET